MADPCPAALVVEDVAGRRIAVAGREADVTTADLAELGRAGFEQRPFQFVDLLLARQLEAKIDGARRVVHVPIMTTPGRAARYPVAMTETVHDPVLTPRRRPSTARRMLPRTPSGGGTVRIGTASWTDPTMTAAGVFYPTGADSAEERLQFYASRFPLVEVDATYYSLPVRRTSELWVERTPPDFTFDIKAHALMTGQPTETKRLPKALREALPGEIAEKSRIYAKDLPDDLRDDVWAWFADGLEPLQEAGQLGSILLQYPRWFFTSSENRDTIEESVERLRKAGMVPAVEFRSASWFNDKNIERTLKFLGDRKIPLVMVESRRDSSRACRRSSLRPRPTSPSSASTGDAPRPGRPEHQDRRALPLPLRRGRARGVGAARPRGGRPGRADPRPVQQLLCELRRDERLSWRSCSRTWTDQVAGALPRRRPSIVPTVAITQHSTAPKMRIPIT